MQEVIRKPFLYYFKKFKGHLAVGTLALIITDVADVLTPFLLGLILNHILKEMSLSGAAPLLLAFTAASIVTAIGRYAWRIGFAKFHHNVALDLRLKIFKSFFKKDFVDFSGQSTGDKMSLFTKDIENFRMGIGPGVLILFDAILYLTLIPIAMWKLNPSWAISLIFIVPTIPIAMALLEKKLNSLFDHQQKHLSELSSQAQESIEGIKVIKSFRMERFRDFLYDQENKKLFKNSVLLEFIHSSFSPLFEFFIYLSCCILLGIVAFYSDFKAIEVGSLFAFFQYLQKMTWPLSALGFSYMMITEAKSSFRRISPVLETTEYSFSNPKNRENSIELKDLSFAYEDKSLSFELVNLSLKKETSYLIAGKTKSGKSSLIKILSGLVQIKNKESLFIEDSKTAYNPQTPFLFMDSLAKNLDLKSEESSQIDFSKVSFKEEFKNLPNGLKTEIGEKGANLSGGQKQRLCLLRAMRSQATNLLLDEPISAVDEKTKSNLITELKKLSKEKNLIIATSNPEHFLWMDRVIWVTQKNENLREIQDLSMQEALEKPDFKYLLKDREDHA